MQALAWVQESHCSVLRVQQRALATKTWPVGQAAKTAASHAANVGSIPARVTTYFFLKEKVSKESFNQVLWKDLLGKEVKEETKLSLLTFFLERK